LRLNTIPGVELNLWEVFEVEAPKDGVLSTQSV